MNAILLAVLALCLVAGPAAAQAPQGAEGPVYKAGDGVSAPVLVKEVKPQYTAEAKDARIQGTVVLECVVETDGRVGDVQRDEGARRGPRPEASRPLGSGGSSPGRRTAKRCGCGSPSR